MDGESGGVPCCCESTAPTPVVEASTSTTKGSSGLGWIRSGALVKAFLRVLIASVARGFHDRDLALPLSRSVRGLVMVL